MLFFCNIFSEHILCLTNSYYYFCHFYLITGKSPDTLLTSIYANDESANIPLSIFNSSSTIYSAFLFSPLHTCFVHGAINTNLIFINCHFVAQNSFFIDSYNNILFKQLSIIQNIHPLVSRSLVYSRTKRNQDIDASSKAFFTDSSFSNIVLPAWPQTLLSSGYASVQELRRCSFANISTADEMVRLVQPSFLQSSTSILLALTANCNLHDTTMTDCEDTFYGRIVTGPTAQTLSSFKCKNSSFIRCTHVHSPHRTIPVLSSLYPSNDYTETGGTRTGDTDRYTVDATGVYMTFTNVTFDTCCGGESSGPGGAVDVWSQSYVAHLQIKKCTFKNCYTYRDGGAVSCENTNTFIVESNTFTNCTCIKGSFTTSANLRGGAIRAINVFITYTLKTHS